MAFDYNSRTKWEKERVDRWNKEHEKQVKKLSPAQQELFGEVRDFSSYPHCGFPVINKWSREKVKKDAGGRSLKEILYAECAGLIDILVPKQYKDDFDYMLDQFANYQYSRSLFRPTVRTSDPAAHVLDAFGLMQAYKILGIYGVTPLEYLTERSESAGSAAAQRPPVSTTNSWTSSAATHSPATCTWCSSTMCSRPGSTAAMRL